MPPGRKQAGRPPRVAEAPLADYEKLRVQRIMRNNQMLQRLGVHKLVSMLNSTSCEGKGVGPEDSGSLYDAQESDDSEQDEVNKASHVSKDVPNKSSKNTSTIPIRGARTSKRVVAPDLQEQPPRVTRQKTRELSSAMSPDPQQVPTQILTTTTHDAIISASSPNHDEDQIDVSDEVDGSTQHGPKRVRMGHELEKICKGLCSKIPIHIVEGMRRPKAPMQAAKLASEGGIILRQHMPILTHWKEYKKNESHLTNYIGKGKFTIDTNSKAVIHACGDMLKGGTRQMRYKLKKKYFNGVPANQVRIATPVKCMTDAQWRELVDMWSSSKHKDKCIKNQLNREKVQFQQRTGSRCYIAQAHVVKQEKYKDIESTAIDLFKDFHCSRKTGYSEQVKKAIADMEAIIVEPVQDGEREKTATEVVAQVLPSSSTFLQNVGLQSASKKSSATGVSLQVHELQVELETKRKEAAELKQQIDVQQNELDTLKKKTQDSETAIEGLKKAAQETNALFRQLLSFNRGEINPTS